MLDLLDIQTDPDKIKLWREFEFDGNILILNKTKNMKDGVTWQCLYCAITDVIKNVDIDASKFYVLLNACIIARDELENNKYDMIINNKLIYDIEKIQCSAIYVDDNEEHIHQPRGIDKGFVVTGFRHPNCLKTLSLIANGDNDKRLRHIQGIQGFLTNYNRFVDRKEAAEIAYSAKQISLKKNELFSEDIY